MMRLDVAKLSPELKNRQTRECNRRGSIRLSSKISMFNLQPQGAPQVNIRHLPNAGKCFNQRHFL